MLGEPGAGWRKRLLGARATASTKSHAELDEATELDEGDPADLGARYAALRGRFPHLAVLGGCCGTDHRHVAEIRNACLVATSPPDHIRAAHGSPADDVSLDTRLAVGPGVAPRGASIRSNEHAPPACIEFRALAHRLAHGSPWHAKTRLIKRVLQHRYRDSNPRPPGCEFWGSRCL